MVSDYRSKVEAVRQKEAEDRSRGLGGFVRQMAPVVSGSPTMISGGMMTSKDIVGEAPSTLSPSAAAIVGADRAGGGSGGGAPVVPLADEKKGRLWKSFDENNKERQEEMMRKQEAFHRVMEKRHAREQARKEAAQAKAS